MKEDLNLNSPLSGFGTGGFMDPEKILREIEIEEGMIVADFGCGAGYFALPLAKMVGTKGKIYAIDVLASALESITSKMRTEGVRNIKTARADLEQEKGSKLEDSSIDLVMMANILFQSKNHSAILKEAKRVLKDGGKLVIIDWIPIKSSSFGPDGHLRISQNEIQNKAVSLGFKFERGFEVDRYHYGLLFRK